MRCNKETVDIFQWFDSLNMTCTRIQNMRCTAREWVSFGRCLWFLSAVIGDDCKWQKGEDYADVFRYRIDDPSRLENHTIEWRETA